MTAGYNPNALDALVLLAEIDAQREVNQQVLEIAEFVLSHASSTREMKDRAERLRAQLELQLKPSQVEAARSRAQSMTLVAMAQEVQNN